MSGDSAHIGDVINEVVVDVVDVLKQQQFPSAARSNNNTPDDVVVRRRAEDLLLSCGVKPAAVCRCLATKYGLARVQEVVEAARTRAKGNPAGWIRSALEREFSFHPVRLAAAPVPTSRPASRRTADELEQQRKTTKEGASKVLEALRMQRRSSH